MPRSGWPVRARSSALEEVPSVEDGIFFGTRRMVTGTHVPMNIGIAGKEDLLVEIKVTR